MDGREPDTALMRWIPPAEPRRSDIRRADIGVVIVVAVFVGGSDGRKLSCQSCISTLQMVEMADDITDRLTLQSTRTYASFPL